jgi:NodT family efflux transporter outer membrane factor (OMF) lipoprotein
MKKIMNDTRLNHFAGGYLVGLALFFLSACAPVGPDHHPPAKAISSQWQTSLQGGLADEPIDRKALSHWWRHLNDPLLSKLIDQAVVENLDLKEARSRVQEARARRGVAEAGLFPHVDASGQTTQMKGSKETGAGTVRSLFTAGFDAGWEVDVFGGVRRSIEAADADIQATQAGLRDVLVTLTAEVGLNYVEMRTYQARLMMAEENLKEQEGMYDLIRQRFDAGLSDALSMEQARYNVENTRSQIPTLRSGLEASRNRIEVLLGKIPGQLRTELAPAGPIPVTPQRVAVGIPADCIRQRPDVSRAEWELAAQTARIGVATAEGYPKFSLIGSIGIETLTIGGVASSDDLTYRIGPRFSWRIFDAGAIRRNIQIQSALQEQALARYESVVLKSLEEVENALKAYAEEQNRREYLTQASQAATNAVTFAREKFRAGLIAFYDVLDAQRSLFSFEDLLAQSKGAVTTDLITLYKALGGGWEEMSENESAQP